MPRAGSWALARSGQARRRADPFQLLFVFRVVAVGDGGFADGTTWRAVVDGAVGPRKSRGVPLWRECGEVHNMQLSLLS